MERWYLCYKIVLLSLVIAVLSELTTDRAFQYVAAIPGFFLAVDVFALVMSIVVPLANRRSLNRQL